MAKLYYRYRGDTFLTVAALLQAHTDVIKLSGGLPGIKDRGALESAVDAPKKSAGGEDAYRTFFTKVAAVGYHITQGHVFNDGNKRTAFTAMLWVLRMNGYAPKLTADAGTTIMLLVATGHLKIPGLRVALIHWCGLDIADATL